jgi:hypothetical protein
LFSGADAGVVWRLSALLHHYSNLETPKHDLQ